VWTLQSAIVDLDPGVPESLRQMIERQIERHSLQEQYVLEAASIAGTEFSSTTVAAALETSVPEIEACLARLVRRGQLVRDRDVEEWPDNTLSASYTFAHALYENVLYHRQSAARRMQFHRRIGLCLERAYGLRAAEIASELALHFEKGREYAKAVHYLRQAAASAAARYANREAIDYLTRALALPSDASTLYDLTSLRGDFLRDMGSIEESIAAFQTALEIASHGAEKARAWVGIAAGMRVMDRYYEALEALKHAEAAISGQSLPDDRARIHHLRGNIYFPLGNIEGCLDQHEQALACAREAGSTRCEAQALSGLGDAWYQRGRMRTAYEHFDRCIELCRTHGFRRIEMANLAMRGLARSYQNDYQGALEDNLTAAEMAVTVGDLRAEMVARDNAAWVLLEKAGWRGVIEQAERGLVLARQLSARRFEADMLGLLGLAMAALGHRTEADRLLQEAYLASRESDLAFSGPQTLGALALISTDAATRRWALTEGEKLLREGCVSHNYFYFYKDAIEACLNDQRWSEVERYASGLEDYTRDEPLPWSDFLIARARALAAHGRGERGEEIDRELRRLRDQANRAGLKASLPAIEKALGG
ncbi:MAG: tetratricopeptide repeat protein, partial [Pseudomonadota bacterium]|nr:tetratricopeptide repeat protein [Pseudomonadota bacterium]